MKCHLCGYEWDYKGKHPFYATCPKCLRKVKIIQKTPIKEEQEQ